MKKIINIYILILKRGKTYLNEYCITCVFSCIKVRYMRGSVEGGVSPLCINKYVLYVKM